MLVVLSMTVSLSLLYVRRHIYEGFLKLHLLLAIALLVLLWFHIPIHNYLPLVCLVTATTLWVVQTILWAGTMLYRNPLSRNKSIGQLDFLEDQSRVAAVKLVIKPSRRWYVSPGQYVYITVPGLFTNMPGRLQAHPFMIAWSEKDPGMRDSQIVLFISCRNGFSAALPHCEGPFPVILDGPYGGTPSLDQYDKILFLAGGIGIVTHLLHIRQLLRAHDDKCARVRRLTLVWLLDSQGIIVRPNPGFVIDTS